MGVSFPLVAPLKDQNMGLYMAVSVKFLLILLECKTTRDCPILPCPSRMLQSWQLLWVSELKCIYCHELLGLLEDVDLGTNLESWSQLDVHGTHEVFLLQKQQGLAIYFL